MKYKFKIGDKITVIKVAHIGTDKHYWGDLLGQSFIITKRTKGQLGNSYEVTERETDSSYAWVYEGQMEFSSLLSQDYIDEVVETYKQQVEKENEEFRKDRLKLLESMKTMSEQQKRITMAICFPFHFAMLQSAEEMVSRIGKRR
jgi:hypothetical protein